MRRCLKRKRGPLSETPLPLAKKPLTLAGSNHPSNADNDGEAQKPQPIDASAGHRNIENNVAVPNEVCLCAKLPNKEMNVVTIPISFQ